MMIRIRFTDGPADGQALNVERAPVFLRAVKSPRGWDALDQLTDTAAGDEHVYLYVQSGAMVHCFIDGRDPKTGKRWGAQGMVQYSLCAEQPEAPILRDNSRWVKWIEANADRLLPEWAKMRHQR